MEQRERPIPPQQAAPTIDEGGSDDVLGAMGTLLASARTAVSQRLSADSRRYVSSARQHGGQ